MGKTKKASEIFHPVDPELKVIDGGTRRTGRKVKAGEWEKSEGEICPECGEEMFRVIDGICFSCYNRKIMERDLKMEARSERRYFADALRRGTISMKQLKEGHL